MRETGKQTDRHKMEVWACLVFLLIQTTLVTALPKPDDNSDGEEEIDYENVGPFRISKANESKPIADPAYRMIEGDIKSNKFEPFYAGTRNIWPNGIIPFTIDCSLHKNTKAIKALEEAMISWETKTDYCIQFVPKRHHDKQYVTFAKLDGCWSRRVGFHSKPYTVSIGRTCEYKHVMEHELGHVIGFYHEQSRTDRDRYIDIRFRYIEGGKADNFDIAGGSVNSGEKYDFDSIMHYPFWAFRIPHMPNPIVPKPPYDKQKHTPYKKISESDIRQTLKLYKCPLRSFSVRSFSVRSKRSSQVLEDCSNGKRHRSCNAWAKSGHCKRNPGAMLFNCPISCNNCAPCTDRVENCKEQSKNCYNYGLGLELHTFLMNCRLTCEICKSYGPIRSNKPITEAPAPPVTSSTPPPPTTPRLPTTPSKPPTTRPPKVSPSGGHPFPPFINSGYTGKKCEDRSTRCARLKQLGRCQTDPGTRRRCMLTCKDFLKEKTCEAEVPRPDGGKCTTPFGISAFNKGRPRGIMFKASTYRRGGWKYPPYAARLYNQDDGSTYTIGAWCAQAYDRRGKAYLEIAFNRKRHLAAIATQGRPKFYEHVKNYELELYDKEKREWSWYKEGGKIRVFDANCDESTPVINKLGNPSYVDAIRIYPLDYVGGRCLRVELYGCNNRNI